jgi:hypothetical protein
VPLQCLVGIELVLEDPFACHHVGMRWPRHEIPSVVMLKGDMLARINEATTIGLGHRGELCSMEQGWNAKAMLSARLHQVVGHLLDSNITLGKRCWRW